MDDIREDLIKQREALDAKLAELDKDKVKFSVDAGLIDRLGRELVGRPETAVSELVKNAYDADATEVTLQFIDTDVVGGTLIVEDDGHGMDLTALRNGFMRLSSTDKVHNPVSPKFNRKRAGRKGIGRFATQRLGRKLTITTQTFDSEFALQVVINWDDYEIDRDIDLIVNTVSQVPKVKPYGTQLKIEYSRENWTYSEIQRVFRYVSDLLQPSYLSDRLSKSEVKFASQNDTSFSVRGEKITNGIVENVADIDKSFFNKSLAVFEGFIDSNGDGFCSVESKSLKLSALDDLIEISAGSDRDKISRYLFVKNVHFKAYYFIYNRPDYYEGKGIAISATELRRVNDFAQNSSGIKLYRNGFRVPPYGETGDDWLGLDEKVNMASHARRVPMSNRNLFGFVEIVDEKGDLFEETSSREGVLRNTAFNELVDFLMKAIAACRLRVENSVGFLEKKSSRDNKSKKKNEKERKEKFKQFREYIKSEKKSQDNDGNQDGKDESDENNFSQEEAEEFIDELEQSYYSQIDEIAMLRVLAGIGLSIGEFVHEIRQFGPTFQAELDVLEEYPGDKIYKKSIEGLKRNFEQFKTYAAYFDETIGQNTSRELKPIEIRDVVNGFLNVMQKSAQKNDIDIQASYEGYDLFTCPMHPSEWSSIFFNLYSNAKKAIMKAGVRGKISIAGREENEKIMLEFSDNGIGIPEENKERIFTPFFTTSTPVGRSASQNEEMIGSGLGLKIVSDIIESYGGEIFVINPPEGYNTSLHIELPKATKQQVEQQNDEYLFSS